jgi:hypothetical protein
MLRSALSSSLRVSIPVVVELALKICSWHFARSSDGDATFVDVILGLYDIYYIYLCVKGPLSYSDVFVPSIQRHKVFLSPPSSFASHASPSHSHQRSPALTLTGVPLLACSSSLALSARLSHRPLAWRVVRVDFHLGQQQRHRRRTTAQHHRSRTMSLSFKVVLLGEGRVGKVSGCTRPPTPRCLSSVRRSSNADALAAVLCRSYADLLSSHRHSRLDLSLPPVRAELLLIRPGQCRHARRTLPASRHTPLVQSGEFPRSSRGITRECIEGEMRLERSMMLSSCTVAMRPHVSLMSFSPFLFSCRNRRSKPRTSTSV